MAEGERRLRSLEQRNQTLMEKIRSLQKANANLRQMNSRLREENEVFKSTEEILLRDNDKIKKKVHQLKELQESLPFKKEMDEFEHVQRRMMETAQGLEAKPSGEQLREPRQDDIYVLEEQLCACTCQRGSKRKENIEPIPLRNGPKA